MLVQRPFLCSHVGVRTKQPSLTTSINSWADLVEKGHVSSKLSHAFSFSHRESECMFQYTCLQVLSSVSPFSAPETKAQVHYCDHIIIVRASVVRLSLTFHIFDFSSETTERNSTLLDRKQDLNVLYQVCVFRADQNIKMANLTSDWLWHFLLLLWNRWTEFNETWQKARSQ